MSTIDVAARRVPPLGGFSPTLVLLELRRMLRNRRTIAFTLIIPGVMTALMTGQKGKGDPGWSGNLGAYLLVSIAVYASALMAASVGSGVATERALGWSRQLRLTPLNPISYIGAKTVVAVFAGAISIGVANAVGLMVGKAHMPTGVWVSCMVLALVCTLTFAALGVFVGYIVPSENAMQILGPGLALFSFLGGIFIPLSSYTAWVRDIAYWTPMYGVGAVGRAPLTHDLPWYAVVNALAWLCIFVAGAAWRMSKDTARV